VELQRGVGMSGARGSVGPLRKWQRIHAVVALAGRFAATRPDEGAAGPVSAGPPPSRRIGARA
jgi:hypothetical protein